MKGNKYFALVAVVLAGAVMMFGRVLADDGPVTMNANPQGLVTNSTVKLSLDTQDLARCRYSEDDADYDEMDEMDTPDGLYHSVSLGSLSDGSYTYYARCMDFMGIANEESTKFVFKVGDLNSGDDNDDNDNGDEDNDEDEDEDKDECDSNRDCATGETCKSGTCTEDDNECDADRDCATGEICKNGICKKAAVSSGDTIAPTISSPMPSGTLYDSYVSLSVSTSEAADCRYSWYDKTYDSMTLSFSTSNRYYHTASAQLSSYGYYTYYVRCKDDAGNVNLTAGKISFRYASRTPISNTTTSTTTTPPPAKDTTSPVISSLSPSGDVKTASTTIECTTDEKAICKYDIKDGDYDGMANTMDVSDTGKSFSKDVVLDKAGSYTYYIRCKDQAGNKSASSSQIGFTYVVPVVEGPKISNVQPKGTIYQNKVALILQTDKAADCRYSTEDVDYEDMEDEFSTNDGLLQQASLVLGDFDGYTYYVRCADKSGNETDGSTVINFTYKSLNGEDDEELTASTCEKDDDCKEGKVCESGICKEKETDTAAGCADITTSDTDGACDPINDCVCDPDCPVSGDDADADCANVKPAGDNSWIVVLLIGIVLIVVIVIIIAIIKKRGNDEEDVELP